MYYSVQILQTVNPTSQAIQQGGIQVIIDCKNLHDVCVTPHAANKKNITFPDSQTQQRNFPSVKILTSSTMNCSRKSSGLSISRGVTQMVIVQT